MSLVFLESVKKMPLVALPVRTAVVPLGDARVMISPGSQLTPAQLASAGPVTDIVAPSLLHTAGMPGAARAFPKARLWGPAGVKEKHPELTWHGVLDERWPYQAKLAAFPLGGVERTREVVFVDRATRSLLVTDLAFNMVDTHGLGARLLYGLAGTYGRFAISKIFLLLAKDRKALAGSLATVLAQDFDTIVPSHGAVVPSGGKAMLAAAARERGLA